MTCIPKTTLMLSLKTVPLTMEIMNDTKCPTLRKKGSLPAGKHAHQFLIPYVLQHVQGRYPRISGGWKFVERGIQPHPRKRRTWHKP